MCVQRLAELTAELHEFVALDGAPVVPISAVTGAGMDSLRSTIASALRQPSITAAATSVDNDATETTAATATAGTATSDSTPAAVQQSGKKSKRKQNAAKHSSTGIQQQQPQQQQQQQGAVSSDVPAMASVLDYVSSPQLGTRMVLLMYQGTLTAGAHFASGRVWGYVRALRNEVNKTLFLHYCSNNSSGKRAHAASSGCGASTTKSNS
jgi:translation initiation factor IF-2